MCCDGLFGGCETEGSEAVSKKSDGGPAFPQSGETFIGQEGMTLRDWFAGQALAGLLSPEAYTSQGWTIAVARDAYEIADAMIAARESNSEGS